MVFVRFCKHPTMTFVRVRMPLCWDRVRSQVGPQWRCRYRIRQGDWTPTAQDSGAMANAELKGGWRQPDVEK